MLAQLSPAGGVPEPLQPYSQAATELFAFLLVAAVVYFVGRVAVVPLLLRGVRRRNRNNPTLLTATETYLQVLLVGLALLFGLVAAGYGDYLVDTDSAIVIAALTFALGVAGQEVFGSLISGIFLVADPDFNVGDWISWSGGEGTVEAVDFRVTRIRTPNNETITVPNTALTTNALTRPFGRDTFRVTEQVFVSYAEDTEHALMELQQVAANHDRVMEEPAPSARILDLGPDSITAQAEFWVDAPAREGIADLRSDFRRRVKRRFDEEALTLAPPSGQELSGEVSVKGADTDA
ncbi:mechanosensitive ion channel family protein [Halorarius litoreus]|uniref:mechanosensitive ion channel family protein n=1 Tax=Halorarius litoreus TaxID=2962676 RepID=UPI0020CF9ABC|nr:mechanosensitive ion channel family protein [Halorarius litoreus]